MPELSAPLCITLCHPHGLSHDAVRLASALLADAGGYVSAEVALDPPFAVDLLVRDIPAAAARAVLEPALAADLFVQPATAPRIKGLLVADMDSTMIGQECIDELADYAGKKAEIAAITERAMQGELDFAEALEARVAALKGLPVSAIARCLEERITLTAGATTLIATMTGLGARCVLISGGFTAFTEVVAARIGFHRQVANRLGVKDHALDGTVAQPIVDSATKRATLISEAEALGLPLSACIAVGDGANDIPMLEAAGLGVAYHAKPKAIAAADAAVRHGDLGALLWAQGIPRAQWAITSSLS